MRRLVTAAMVAWLLCGPVTAPAAATGPRVLLVVTEKVMGVFDTTGFEEPRHVEAILAEALAARGLAPLDLDAVERSLGRARARQLLEGDEIVAREVALQQQADYLLTGTAISKPAGTRLFGTNMQSLQGTVSLRLIRNDDGRVLAAGSGQAAQAHLDEVQGGILALTEAANRAMKALEPVLESLVGTAPQSASDLDLQIEGLASFRHLDYLMGWILDDLPGVTDARLRGFHGGVADIDLFATTDSEAIARAAGNARFNGFRLRITHVTPSRIEMEAILEE